MSATASATATDDDGKLESEGEPEPDPAPDAGDPPLPKPKATSNKELQRQLLIMKKEFNRSKKAMEQKLANKEAEIQELAARNIEMARREKRQATPIRSPFPPKRQKTDVVDFEGFNKALRADIQEDQKDAPDAMAPIEKDITNVKNVDPDIMAQKWLQELITQNILQNISKGQSVQHGQCGFAAPTEDSEAGGTAPLDRRSSTKEHAGADSHRHRRERATVANKQIPEFH